MKTIRLPARIENLDRFLGFLSDFLTEKGFPEPRLQEIGLAAEEALVNIIRHAFSGTETGEVEIRCGAEDEDRWSIEFRDRGIPFDPLSLPQPDLSSPLEERKIGGLGVFLIRKMINEVRHRREGDQNILTFVVRKKRGS